VNDKKPMSTIETTIAGYPKILFFANVGMMSENNPNAGIARIYTSGCPNTQNKCCQYTESPSGPLKNLEPNNLSNIKRYSPIDRTAKAIKIINDVIKLAQEKSGIFINVIPGARCLMMVTIKFNAVRIVPIPDICTPKT